MGLGRVVYIVFLLVLPVITFPQKKGKKIKISLKITVRNQAVEDELLPYSSVKIIGTDNLSAEMKTNKKGVAKFNHLFPGYKYTFEVTKDKCLGNKGTISTEDLKESKEFVVDVYLYCGCHRIRFPDLDFSLEKASIPQNQKDSIQYIYDIMTENPTIIVSAEVKYFLGEKKQIALERVETIKKALLDKGIPEERLLFSIKKKFRRKKKTEHTVDLIQIVSWDYIPKDE